MQRWSTCPAGLPHLSGDHELQGQETPITPLLPGVCLADAQPGEVAIFHRWHGRWPEVLTNLGLQLLLLSADLLLCFFIQLPHLLEMVRVSPARAGGGYQKAPQDVWSPPALFSVITDPCHITLGL